jgi:hypothetical protein
MTPLRARLFNPSNAVPDTGIDLRRPNPNVVPIKRPFVWPGNLCGEFWLPHDVPGHAPPDRSQLERIKKAVSQVWPVSVVVLESARRHRRAVIPRQVALALCRRLTKQSLPQIGRAFGGRDHTTVFHAVRKMQPHIDAVAAELAANATALEWARAMKRRINRHVDFFAQPAGARKAAQVAAE